MKYTIETRLYSKNNKDIIEYFDEIVNQYNYVFRKVYYIIRNNPKINVSSLNTKLQNKYSISKRTANSIIKTVQGRINSIKELKKTEIKQKEYKLKKIEEKLKGLIPKLSKIKVKAKNNKLSSKELLKYKNLKRKVAFMKIKKDKLINKIKSLKNQIEINKFKLTFGTKKLLNQDVKKFLSKRDNQIVLIGSKEETSCNQMFQLKYITKVNQFIIMIRKDFNGYKQAKKNEKYAF